MTQSIKPRPETPEERAQRILEDPQSMGMVTKWIGSGRTLIELAEHWGIEPDALSIWIKSSNDRDRAYLAAKIRRDEYLMQKTMSAYAGIAFADLRDFIDDDGNPLPPSQWPEGFSPAVKRFTIRESVDYEGKPKRRRTIHFDDKLKALDSMARILGMFKDKVEHSGEVTLADLITEPRPKPLGE